MTKARDLRSLVPGAPESLYDLMDSTRGPPSPPVRSEIFGANRFAQHGRSLGTTHRASRMSLRAATFFPRLENNMAVLQEAHQYIGMQARTGYDISPAAEWLLDNFHTIEAQVKEIHEGLPRSFFRTLPMLTDAPLAGLPRIYGVAWAFVAHTDSAFNEEMLIQFLRAYQETRDLRLCEVWALPTTLRVVLVENLRRLAERVATNKAAREVANMCFDKVESYGQDALDQLLDLLNERGVGTVFLAQMSQRLHDRRTTGDENTQALIKSWLAIKAPELGAIHTQRNVDQAADNLSVSNAVTSLRAIGDADWTELVGQSSALMRLLLTNELFAAEDTATRDQTLHTIEDLSKRSKMSELEVAKAMLGLMNSPDETDVCIGHYWLHGQGQSQLQIALGLHGARHATLQRLSQKVTLPLYLLALLGCVAVLMWLVLPKFSEHSILVWPVVACALALLFPASEAAVALVNRLISESRRPQHLPRLAFAEGIPQAHRVMVVIPCILSSPDTIRELANRLELHYLANPEPHAQFALLSDWNDSRTEHDASDAARLALALDLINALNARYPATPGDAGATQRFIVLHRERKFCTSEQCWMGWERKRGKLEQLVTALATDIHTAFLPLGAASMAAQGIQYIVTLDSDTQVPPGRLRELVGVAAHPHNQPQLDALGTTVIHGYAIFQPRIVTPLPAAHQTTWYHWLFSGKCGIDPYSAASSEIYQDLFSEGSFTGKGLLHVQAVHAVLCGRLPENLILSHDLLDGAIARCAVVTDVALIEEAPFHADVASSRAHRWIRGDWQLLPLLFRSIRHPRALPIGNVNLWKMVDNLRRSLVAPMSLVLLCLVFVQPGIPPWSALAVVMGAFLAGPLMGVLAGLSPRRNNVAKRHFIHEASIDMLRAVCGGLWHGAQLLQQSLLAIDAVARALYRISISHRHLLQWTTAATAQSQAQTNLPALLRLHWREPAAAAVIWAILLWLRTPYPVLAGMLCLLWAGSPVWIWVASRAKPPQPALSSDDAVYLEGIARDSWRLFERCVTAQENYLPPDNLQLTPTDMVAHRTSPTNIGLYLLSVACAKEFGWIGTQDLLSRLENTLSTLHRLERHQGHFLNWYDTQTMAPLLPAYVSTVDSGNLCGHLLTVAQACLELAKAPWDITASARALAAAHRRAASLASSRLRLKPRQRLELQWALADHRATRRSAALDNSNQNTVERLHALAQAFTQLAWQADFGFLYHRKRHLFHIGYRVAERQQDAGFYDLLASESRLTSILAIAKGDISVRHWVSLGRPFFARGIHVGLRSWTGSMFEYLMPSLVLEEPIGSVLHDACASAVREQIAYAKVLGVPWGISESAYAANDDTLAYQYAPQGVPRLALRRTPADELVIAPYATALASMAMPQDAVDNFRLMESLGARGRYGFSEALDYTPSRRLGNAPFSLVETSMAHHQGMSIVALANVLLECTAQRWGMANAPLRAVASLLHERVPREVSLLDSPPSDSKPLVRQRRRAPGMLREVVPGFSAVEPTHLLSNGRYTVTLRSNGAGYSQWGTTGLTRHRDDALRDEYGSFFFIRRPDQPFPVSLTQHPAPDPQCTYRSVYHADRVCLDATWPDLESQITVWVSPEDDVELRTVELRNLGDEEMQIELMSCFEVTLAAPRADESHPAFSNMFVQAAWNDEHQALLFHRQPRLQTENHVQAAHFLATTDTRIVEVRTQTDRLRWRGRNRNASQMLAESDALPSHASAPNSSLTTGLDPVCALVTQLRIAPKTHIVLTFATAISDNASTLHAMIDKYRQSNNVTRASLMSATLTGIRLRALRIRAENFAAMQPLTTALVFSLTRPGKPITNSTPPPQTSDRRLLWRFGISGDRPLILVSAGVPEGLGLLRSMAHALHLWSWSGTACDLVVVNSELQSYAQTLHREITALKERHANDMRGRAAPATTAFHLLKADELSPDELSALKLNASLRFHADGRPLTHHVQEWLNQHEQAAQERDAGSVAIVTQGISSPTAATAPMGQFSEDAREFHFAVSDTTRPVRPWVNVLSNPQFGGQISESGSGNTWAINSRLNQLTAWKNDPVSDPPSEWFLLQDCKTMKTWSMTANAWQAKHARFEVLHGQGYTTMRHTQETLTVQITWCVDAVSAVKHIQVSVSNYGHKSQSLRLIGIVEWMMGSNRSDRSTVLTASRSTSLGGSQGPVLLCTQREISAGFGGGTAFFCMVGQGMEPIDWTCDRREFFDVSGHPVVPDHLGQHAGVGQDPCAALSARWTLAPGETAERVFLLGYGANADAAQSAASHAAETSAHKRLEAVKASWDAVLGTTVVKTPDPLLDAMVNRWLLYQTITCRMWAKAGFYQAGGATGFRDQLQDAMALAWAAPDVLRGQIVLAASRQFVQGDVQHWWHAPLGAGVRTHFSDDLLWLPLACAHYLHATDDVTLLDQRVPFLDGQQIPAGEEDAYFVPTISTQDATVFEHAALAIDRSLRVGAHGLPLMGSGDWNDGMNQVGIGGQGESVWLGWFLCQIVDAVAPLAHARGETERARTWEAAAVGWKAALRDNAWDGQWFKRAYFDNGQPLGANGNPEAHIDLIAQAWSVLSHAAPVPLQHIAMASVDSLLVDPAQGFIKLLDPPLQNAVPSAGYIQAYPAGIRENGGQYSHAGVWALMAIAELAKTEGASALAGDDAYRYFTYLSPAHRAAHPTRGLRYGIEPYVMAGDVYTQAPYAGKGGWSWYTGAAAWMHRAAVESLFGLQINAQTLAFHPCLPSHWKKAEITLKRDTKTMRFVLLAVNPETALAAIAVTAEYAGAVVLLPQQALPWPTLREHTLFVIPMLQG